MPQIQVLDQITIDKIAAGEVIERPASIVKELAENAIDAGASTVAVEIQDGGISFIRITDNGCGIQREDVPNAFLRHSTSKIRSVDDLTHIASLGFRGEALSSIAAVTKTELITKTKEEAFGTRYTIEGGREISIEDTGAPDGTTFLIRQLFYNVPARRKFLKTAMTEAGHIQELLMRLALSHPEVSFQFINNSQEKLRTSGNGKLKDVIYSIYGREAASNLITMDYGKGRLLMTGFLGKPLISRGNRNFENFFINGRYVKSAMISKALEDAYRDFVMQHKFPFVVLHFHIDGEDIDINVHPTKMELRFQKQQEVYNTVYEGVHRTLLEPELIPVVEAPKPPVKEETVKQESPFLLKPKAMSTDSAEKSQMAMAPDKTMNPQITMTPDKTVNPQITMTPDKIVNSVSAIPPKGTVNAQTVVLPDMEPCEAKDEDYFLNKMRERVMSAHNRTPDSIRETGVYCRENKHEQMDLFEENLLKREVKADYKLIGQVFDTYWLVEFSGSLYIIDQHAAHERVLYERTLKEMAARQFTSQYLSPPIILSLSMQEAELLNTHLERFQNIGFEIEPFGGDEYAVRAVPDNLFGIAKKELLMEMLDDLADGITTNMAPELIDQKVASMSCKAAVKGNNRLSAMEADSLICELLSLENPYHCPHGRPTIIAMTKRELEKKFKRIV